ncbi:hypothetical protein DPMN_194266 [Dreissena polymorpha]|uniref:Uncharacterized protein n=1 Tax=Dreissena polymorpha TaxID=45954 RepID=A0A9D3Y5U7_DREPO|nr:hypothetical protein DPMN_194266 [Dreissena polymorpha]
MTRTQKTDPEEGLKPPQGPHDGQPKASVISDADEKLLTEGAVVLYRLSEYCSDLYSYPF